MREAIIIGVVVGLLFFAAGVIMTALAVKYATNSILWDVLLWSGIALMVASVATLILYIHSQSSGGAFWVPALLINLGVYAIISGVAYTSSSAPASTPPSAPVWSWVWDPLTPEQSDKIYFTLKDKPPRTIEVACDAITAGLICDSFDALFKKLNWDQKFSARRGQMFTRGVTGFAYEVSDETGRLLKEAIEGSTSFTVNIGRVNEYVIPPHARLLIGAKPLPEPMPASASSQIAAISQKMKSLAVEIARFASDRAREEQGLPPREAYPIGEVGMTQHWRRGMQFRQQTETLFSERFGTTVSSSLTDLQGMGIELSFGIDAGSPLAFATWFGTIGTLLEAGKIAEARSKAVDARFWMAQPR